MPASAQTLPQVVRTAGARHAAKPAVVDGGVTLSYTELLRRSEQVAQALLAHGVAAGDRVAVWAPNRFEWILAACGTHMAGAVLVPINTRMKGAEATDILMKRPLRED